MPIEGVEAVRAWGDRHSDIYAGLYVEGDEVCIALTSGLGEHESELRQLLPATSRMRVVPARNTFATLRATAERLSGDVDALSDEGVRIALVGIDERRNAVAVQLAEARQDWVDLLRQRYGEEVLAFREAGTLHTRPDDRRPPLSR